MQLQHHLMTHRRTHNFGFLQEEDLHGLWWSSYLVIAFFYLPCFRMLVSLWIVVDMWVQESTYSCLLVWMYLVSEQFSSSRMYQIQYPAVLCKDLWSQFIGNVFKCSGSAAKTIHILWDVWSSIGLANTEPLQGMALEWSKRGASKPHCIWHQSSIKALDPVCWHC